MWMLIADLQKESFQDSGSLSSSAVFVLSRRHPSKWYSNTWWVFPGKSAPVLAPSWDHISSVFDYTPWYTSWTHGTPHGPSYPTYTYACHSHTPHKNTYSQDYGISVDVYSPSRKPARTTSSLGSSSYSELYERVRFGYFPLSVTMGWLSWKIRLFACCGWCVRSFGVRGWGGGSGRCCLLFCVLRWNDYYAIAVFSWARMEGAQPIATFIGFWLTSCIYLGPCRENFYCRIIINPTRKY